MQTKLNHHHWPTVADVVVNLVKYIYFSKDKTENCEKDGKRYYDCASHLQKINCLNVFTYNKTFVTTDEEIMTTQSLL